MRIIFRLSLLATLSIIFNNIFSQVEAPEETYLLSPLTPQEEMELMCLPELKLPAELANRDLPYMVDNSTQIYLRPAFQQAGLCCGQASSIGYNFTYEMSRERDLNASVLQNQYVTHFAWNFMNGGEGYYGVSYLHSMQILKECGTMNAVDYGGSLSYGGPTRFISGYNAYYNGMHNRITNAYQIQVGTPEGLQVLKNWLENHLEGSTVGGVASFYAQHMTASQLLPAGTPEAGKYVLTSFGGSPNHAMTIVGYNDSIRWDYNNDGQYTNNLDINSDGTVNMKDWEIGGFKMVQSYGGVPNWGDQGFAYMMYKTVADNLGSGGIWNHCVHVLDVKASCDPKLTAKVILKHDRRDRIKILAGVSNYIGNQEPDYLIGYPIFDYQGGNHYMQGGTTEADKTIEIGLDLSKLLSYVDLGDQVKVFLQVVEDDDGSTYSGEVTQFSIFDHTAGGTQIICPNANVPLVNNDTTTLSINHTFDFNRVHIVNETIPPAPEGEFYSCQLTADGGSEPYIWEFDKTYDETNQPAAFPQVTATQLTPSNSTSGYVTQAIPFAFPFYDSSYSSITVHVDGYLMFDQQLYPFPYYQDDKVLFNITRHISPFLNQHQEVNSGQGCGIWYEGNEQYVTFRWKTCLTENTAMIMNYAVRLYADGTIKFFYGAMNGCDLFLWMAGIGDGDNFNYQATAISNHPIINPNTSTTLLPYDYPPEMELSETGLFSGTPQQSYGNQDITFKVTDNNFIFTKKTFTFTSTGIIVSDSVISGGDPVISYSETAWMSMSVLNIRPETIPGATMTIQIDDPYITLIDSTENLGDLPYNVERNIVNAFRFNVSSDIPNEHLINIEAVITSDTNEWATQLLHYAYAPVVAAANEVVSDPNQRLDVGETSDIVVTYLNTGGVGLTSVNTLLTTIDPYVTINQPYGNIPLMEVGISHDLTYNVTVSQDCLPGHEVLFCLDIQGDGNYITSDTFCLFVGLYCENFESGDMELFAWGHLGDRAWRTDTYGPYEGGFCARSGVITHNEESVMLLDMDVLEDGVISFYQRTSCENDTSAANNFDYLCFRIDGAEMGRWDGETNWAKEQFPVSQGFHRFEWIYHKDGSTNYRFDAAWVDLITFASSLNCSPVMAVDQEALNLLLRSGESETRTLLLTDPAQGELNFTADMAGIQPVRNAGSGGRNIDGSSLVLDADRFHAGSEYTWHFRTYNGGNDNEWIKQIYISFPQGLLLAAATDFTGGSGGPMIFQGPFGNGVTAHWFGEDANGWGVVHMGELASSEVSILPDAALDENVSVYFEVQGEVYGSPPHTVTGTIPLRNLGPVIPWLNIDKTGGTIPGNSSDSIHVTVNAAGMADGVYHAWLLLQDNFQGETIIPVNLTIDTYMGENRPGYAGSRFSASPNPFRETTTFSVCMNEKSSFRIEISTLEGQIIASLPGETDARNNKKLTWDGKDKSGESVPAGIYLARLISGENSFFVKIIHTK